MRRRASAAGVSLAVLRWACCEWLQDAAERCTASPVIPPPAPTLPPLGANPLPPSPGMEATLLARSLPEAAPAARSREVRVGVGMRWLVVRLTGGLALPLRLACRGLPVPEAVRLGRLLPGRLLYAEV